MARILLFDVDQTLLWSGGAGSLAMARAFHQVYGIEDGFRRVEFSGRTDQAILRQALLQHGLLACPESASGGRRGRPDRFAEEMSRFQQAYYRLLEPALREVDGGAPMPGIPELLARLSVEDGVRLGVATGNFRQAAFAKLRHFGLDGYLSDGGFGDDAEDRGELVAIAIERVLRNAQRRAEARPTDDGRANVWIIGDTPLDIAAAQANGARSLGVATGSSSEEELRAAGADVTMPDLSDTEAAMRALVG